MRAGNTIGILLLIPEVSMVERGPTNDFLHDALESFKIFQNIYQSNPTLLYHYFRQLLNKSACVWWSFLFVYFSSVGFLLKFIITADVICTQGFKRSV